MVNNLIVHKMDYKYQQDNLIKKKHLLMKNGQVSQCIILVNKHRLCSNIQHSSYLLDLLKEHKISLQLKYQFLLK